MQQILTRLYDISSHLQADPKPAHGLTPPALDGQVHATRCLAQLRSKDKSIEKYIYLSQLKQSDEHMFYHLCLGNMSVRLATFISSFTVILSRNFLQEFTPIIYTPTVGDACQQYSHIYRRPEGIVSPTHPK